MQVKTPVSAAVLYMLIWVKTIASTQDFFQWFSRSSTSPTSNLKTPASAAVLYMLIWVKTIASTQDFFQWFSRSSTSPTSNL